MYVMLNWVLWDKGYNDAYNGENYSPDPTWTEAKLRQYQEGYLEAIMEITQEWE